METVSGSLNNPPVEYIEDALPYGVKVSYLRDPNNEDRVLTVVRSVKDNVVSYGWSVNNPPTVKEEHICQFASLQSNSRYVYVRREFVKGDKFSKREGRTLALQRYRNECRTINLDGYETPLRAAMRGLNEDKTIPYSVRKIVKDYLSFVRGFELGF